MRARSSMTLRSHECSINEPVGLQACLHPYLFIFGLRGYGDAGIKFTVNLSIFYSYLQLLRVFLTLDTECLHTLYLKFGQFIYIKNYASGLIGSFLSYCMCKTCRELFFYEEFVKKMRIQLLCSPKASPIYFYSGPKRQII